MQKIRGFMQLTMFEKSHEEKARRWMDTNADAFERFCQLAIQYSRNGTRRIGAKFIAEILRWEIELDSDFTEEFKVNNNYVSELARAACRRYPPLKEAFVFRESG